MKRIIYLQFLIILFGLVSILECILNLSPVIVMLTMFICTLLQIFIVIHTRNQNKLMNFLINEEKKKNMHMPVWDEKEQGKLELLRKRVELSTLQNQINPHFLYNTLDSIRSQALIDGQNEIASMTEKLSKFFRYCIRNVEGMVKIQEEINHIQDFYYIQKYRFENRFEMIIKAENERIYDLYIPKLTLQPLIENSISHGLEKTSRKGLVTIKLSMTDTRVIIKVADNGIGMPPDQLERLNERMKRQQVEVSFSNGKHNGIALMNVNSRIKLTFGDEYGIHYRSMEGVGTDAVVTLPIIDEFQRVKYENTLYDRRQ